MNTFYVQTESLSHVGVLRRSGRYPWGSGKRPFQSGGGPKTSSKKQKKETEHVQNLEENEKEKLIKEGNATEVLKYRSQLSNQELQDALIRIRLTSDLERYSRSELKRSMNKVDDIMKGVQITTNWIKIGTDTYNTLAKIYNSTEEGKKKPLTIV